MLSRNVQLAFNQFALDYASAQNIDVESLVSRLAIVQTDELANHIMTNYKNWRYALAKRELAFLNPNPKLNLYTAWKYYNLLTGQLITDVIFLPGVNEFFVSDVIKIIGIKPKILNGIFNTGNIIIKNPGNGNNNYTRNNEKVLEYQQALIEAKNKQQTQTASFDMKNILWIGLIGAAAYMVLK